MLRFMHSSRGGILSLRGLESIPGVSVASQEVVTKFEGIFFMRFCLGKTEETDLWTALFLFGSAKPSSYDFSSGCFIEK